jgi:hypothetical protein
MAIVLDGTANTVTPLNGALGATTPSTVAATTVVASSTIKGATTIAVGNATPSASGAGITFPATQSASTDANTLDDYEEGTWTPTDASGAGLTFSQVNASYVKIGKMVYLMAYLAYPTTASSANSLIGGIPFTVSNSTVSFGAANSNTAGLSNFICATAISATTLYGYKSGGALILNSELSAKAVGFLVVYTV